MYSHTLYMIELFLRLLRHYAHGSRSNSSIAASYLAIDLESKRPRGFPVGLHATSTYRKHLAYTLSPLVVNWL